MHGLRAYGGMVLLQQRRKPVNCKDIGKEPIVRILKELLMAARVF